MLTFILILLLPMSGWAEDRADAVFTERSWTLHDVDGNTLLVCDEELSGYYGKLIDQQPCLQRMQEAMRLAEQHKFWPGYTLAKDGWYTEPYISASVAAECDEECRLRKRLEELKENKRKAKVEANAKAQWDATMAECVRGR